jgi:iron complex outermembrane receptor protein
MSELMNARMHVGVRRGLLTTVSAIALMAIVGAEKARAADADADRPSLWIELGGQFDQLNAGASAWVPPVTPPPFPPVTSLPFGHPLPGSVRSAPSIGWDTTARVTFQPENSDWIFTAAASYGRSAKKASSHDQYYPPHSSGKYHSQFFDTRTSTHESHAVIDFKAGKDVGLGMFGAHSLSSLDLGLRYAQFNSTTHSYVTSGPPQHKYAQINDEMHMQRQFTGIGPSISFDSSDPVAGSLAEGLSLDWGANAAILFGRQKAKIASSQIERRHYINLMSPLVKIISQTAFARGRNVIVPNVGGFAGLSFRYAVAKVSFGYRADLFFGALDGGIGVQKTYDRNFYGPFASVSVGL